MSWIPKLSALLLFVVGCASVPLKELPRDLDCPDPAIASIHGVVQTTAGKPIAKAKITFPGYDSTVEIETDSGGYFLLACVVPGGGYKAIVEADGYQSIRLDSLEARVPATDLRLTLREAN